MAASGIFSIENNLNGELVHELDGLESVNCEDIFEDDSEQDMDAFFDEMGMYEEFNYDSFVFDR